MVVRDTHSLRSTDVSFVLRNAYCPILVSDDRPLRFKLDSDSAL